LAFQDYSDVPAQNTTIGDNIFIGPNMERAKVRPSLQQLAADGKALYDLFIAGIGDLPSFIQSGLGAIVRPTQDKLRESVSVLDFIPTQYHAYILAYTDRHYPTDFPSTDNLTSYIQAAIDFCRSQRKALYFPSGFYRITTSLTVYGDEDTGETVITGSSEYGSIIYQATAGQDVLNAYSSGADFRRFTLRGICLRGGRRGINITRTGSQVTSLMHLRNVRLEEHSEIGLRNSQYLISCLFENVVWYYCKGAIYNGRNANNCTLVKPRFEGLDDDIIELASPGGDTNGCENFRLIDPRVESRNDTGITGKTVFKGYRLSNFMVDGGYFENTHRQILAETGSLGLVRFKDTHFTGQESDVEPAGFKSEVFTSDGRVILDNCRFLAGTAGAPHSIHAGQNVGVSEATYGHYNIVGRSASYTGKSIQIVDNTAVTLLSFSRPDPSADGEPAGGLNHRTLGGTVLISGQVKTDTKRASFVIRATILIIAYSSTNIAMTITDQTVSKNDPDSILTISGTPLTSAGASQTGINLQLTVDVTEAIEKSFVGATLTADLQKGDCPAHLEVA
jgi:hypothetical protein